MSVMLKNYRLGLTGMLAGAALTLLALALPLQPAKAQCFGVDLGLVCAGLGVPSAFSHRPPPPYYYGYPYPAYPAYAYPYYNPYYPYP